MSQLQDPVNPSNTEVYDLYEKLKSKRGQVDGMYRTLLNHPALTEHIGNLGTYLRFGSTLPGKYREFIILLTAQRVKASYEWVKHVGPAEQAGLDPAIIEQLKVGSFSFPNDYQLLFLLSDYAFNLQSIPEDLQKQLIELIGIKGLIEGVVLVGFYRMIAGVIACFDVPLPEGEQSPW